MANYLMLLGVGADLVKSQLNSNKTQREFGENILEKAKVIPNIQLSANVNKAIAHSLGREPKGFLVINKSAAGDIFSPSLTNTRITLQSTTNVTISIIVF